MDLAALVTFLVAGVLLIIQPDIRWVLLLLTIGFICQYTTATDQLINL